MINKLQHWLRIAAATLLILTLVALTFSTVICGLDYLAALHPSIPDELQVRFGAVGGFLAPGVMTVLLLIAWVLPVVMCITGIALVISWALKIN